MSFWAATVITNFFSAFDSVTPGWGTLIMTWLRGDFAVDESTLQRFFSLHYLLPFVIAGLVALHIWALHVPGNNNPTGIDVKGPQDTVPFHPYYTVKDGFYLALFVVLFLGTAFFFPDYLGHPDNYIEANPSQTPPHIVPEWYFLPFYAILRAVPSKLFGVLLMFGSIAILFLVPWLDKSAVRSARYRPIYRQLFWVFVAACIALTWAGAQAPEGLPLIVSRIATIYYFAFFLIIMPLGFLETPRPLPDSIAKSVLGRPSGQMSPAPAE
jgi:ubiquinol-cytochrome c reductase cytochrome b subunit